MTKRKFTDEEIKKALVCCLDAECYKCPLLKDNECRSNSVSAILDLINRQQAEIERYRQTVGILAEKNGEVVGLLNGKKTKYIKKDVAEIFKNIAVNRARIEAVEEFVKRLKKRKHRNSLDGRIVFVDVVEVDDIDAVKKEMTEEQK